MDVGQAQEILGRMEDRLRDRLMGTQSDSVSEPECEVHDQEQTTKLQEHLGEIASLRNLILLQCQTLSKVDPRDSKPNMGSKDSSSDVSTWYSQGESLSLNNNTTVSDFGNKSFEDTLEEVTNTMERSFVETLREISPESMNLLEEGSQFTDNHFAFSEGLDVENDDIDSTKVDFEGTDSEIQAAINEIRREASQMDIVMALDQLKTVQTDLQLTTRALRERSIQADELRAQLEAHGEKVACLELERDLYKADAAKLRDDLKTCVDRMFDISAVAGGSSSEPDHAKVETSVPANRNPHDIHQRKPFPDDPTFSAIPPSSNIYGKSAKVQSRSSSGLLGPIYCKSQQTRTATIRRSPSMSDPTKRTQFVTTPFVAEAFPLLGAAPVHGIFRPRPPVPCTENPSTISSTQSNLRGPIADAKQRRHKSFSSAIGNATETNETNAEVDGKENRMCGLFRRRSFRRGSHKSKDIAIMRGQIDQLHTMMKDSLETSEKLRKRLAMISRYYEGIIRRFQEQMAEAKAEKARIKADLDAKISTLDHDRRVTIVQLESKLRQRDNELTRLKRQIDKTGFEI